MKRYFQGGMAALLAAACLFFWYRHKEPDLPVNQSPAAFKLIDQMERDGVPDLTLPRIDGGELSIKELRGQIVIVNFWASWCNPCVEEFPSMLKLVERFKGQIVVYAVATDDDRKDVEAFIKAFGLPKPGFNIVWDNKKEAMKTYGVDKVPESFLVNRDGKLIRKVLGIENWASDNAAQYFDLILSGKIDSAKHQ